MDPVSQGEDACPQSLEEAPRSELVYHSDTPQEVLGKILFLKCIMPDISLSLVHQCEIIGSVTGPERAATESPSSMTVTDCHSRLRLRAIG